MKQMKLNTNVALLVILSMCLINQSLASEPDEMMGSVDIHGFLSQGFLQSEENNFYTNTKEGTFQFNELGISVSTDLTERLRAGIQLFSRHLGDIGNDTPVLDWAYGDYRWKDSLGFRAGKLKLSLGLYNDTRDLDMLRTFIFLPDSLYDENFREILNAFYGVEGYGHIPLGNLGSVNYQIQYGEKNITDDSALKKIFTDERWYDIEAIAIHNFMVTGLEWETPLEGFRLKGWFSRFDFTSTLRTRSVPELQELGIPAGIVDTQTLHDNTFATLSAEYVRDALTLIAEYTSSSDGDDQREEGYYAGATLRVTDWLEFGLYHSVYYPDANDKDGNTFEAQGLPDYWGWHKDTAFSVRCDFNENWTVKLEKHLVNGTASFWDEDNPDGLKEKSSLLAVKTTFNF